MVSAPIVSLSLRAWPADFPTDVSVQRHAPYESRADSVMYRQVLAECGRKQGWSIRFFDSRTVEDQARAILGEQADAVLHGPRTELGAPWGKDQRIALAATIVAA